MERGPERESDARRKQVTISEVEDDEPDEWCEDFARQCIEEKMTSRIGIKGSSVPAAQVRGVLDFGKLCLYRYITTAEQTKMNDCYFEKRDWRICSKEVRVSRGMDIWIQTHHHSDAYLSDHNVIDVKMLMASL